MIGPVSVLVERHVLLEDPRAEHEVAGAAVTGLLSGLFRFDSSAVYLSEFRSSAAHGASRRSSGLRI